VHQAVTAQPSLAAARARVRAADARIPQARSARQPNVSYQEMFQIGNNPVYVFSSLLTQRQFTAADFAIDRLVRPDAVRNFQSMVSAEQVLWDAGAIQSGIRSAEIGKAMSQEEERAITMRTIAQVARAYHGITLAERNQALATEALAASQADGERARTLRDAGMATDADLLAVQVQIANLKQRLIQATAEVEVARAALNQSMGRPLDTGARLTTALTAAAAPDAPAALDRPELRLAGLARESAEAKQKQAHSGLLPQVFVRGAIEADRKDFLVNGGGNWMLMAGMRWNLFDGGRGKAAQLEARSLAESAAAEQRQARSGIELEIRQAQAHFRAATERMAVGESAVKQAEETLRIVRNRYSAGLSTITEVLRSQTALVEARTQQLAATYDQRMAAIQTQLAAGVLKEDSDVLR
jgi:outer membrane protein